MDNNYFSSPATESVTPKKKFGFPRFPRHLNGNTKMNKAATKTVLAIGAVLVLVGGIYFISRGLSGGTTETLAQDGVKYQVKSAKAVNDLNREFQFPLKDEKGTELTKLKYTIKNAELRDEIIVKGNRATAVEGRQFLILNIKLANDFDKPIEMNTRDYVRLIINDNVAEPFAADIHNDPVTIQPISTKETRLGFPINETDTNLKLQVGEIKGPKETIEIKF